MALPLDTLVEETYPVAQMAPPLDTLAEEAYPAVPMVDLHAPSLNFAYVPGVGLQTGWLPLAPNYYPVNSAHHAGPHEPPVAQATGGAESSGTAETPDPPMLHPNCSAPPTSRWWPPR